MAAVFITTGTGVGAGAGCFNSGLTDEAEAAALGAGGAFLLSFAFAEVFVAVAVAVGLAFVAVVVVAAGVVVPDGGLATEKNPNDAAALAPTVPLVGGAGAVSGVSGGAVAGEIDTGKSGRSLIDKNG